MLAAALGLLAGAVIGALGAGGGVLTIPMLVYALGQSAQDATTSSVVIVGVTATAGVLVRLRGDTVNWRTGIAFGAVGVPAAAVGTLLNRQVGEPVLLLSFAGLTVLAAAAMIIDSGRPAADGTAAPDGASGRSHPGGARSTVDVATTPDVDERRLVSAAKVVSCGIGIGFLIGFLGVGGGFLIVPALVIALRMPMACAIGTSLLIISINAAAAFTTRVGVAEFDLPVLIPFAAAAIIGSLAGKRVADRFSGTALTRAFAVMLLAVGAFVAIHSLVTL